MLNLFLKLAFDLLALICFEPSIKGTIKLACVVHTFNFIQDFPVFSAIRRLYEMPFPIRHCRVTEKEINE